MKPETTGCGGRIHETFWPSFDNGGPSEGFAPEVFAWASTD